MRYYFQALAKCLSYRTGVLRQTFFNVYPYMFTPNQLMFLAEHIAARAIFPAAALKWVVPTVPRLSSSRS